GPPERAGRPDGVRLDGPPRLPENGDPDHETSVQIEDSRTPSKGGPRVKENEKEIEEKADRVPSARPREASAPLSPIASSSCPSSFSPYRRFSSGVPVIASDHLKISLRAILAEL